MTTQPNDETVAKELPAIINNVYHVDRPKRGRPRRGKEIRTVYAVRLEPRHRKFLGHLHLEPQTIINGFADLLDRADSENEAALILKVLTGFLSTPTQKLPLLERVSAELLQEVWHFTRPPS